MHQVPSIPGVKADESLSRRFRYEVAQLLERGQITFPGAQPVSFASRHIEELKERDYYVCEKSDGIRCLMYLTQEEDQEVVYLIDRKNEYYFVPDLHFPLKENQQAFHTRTIVDGELVLDTPADGEPIMKFLVYDCLILDGVNLTARTLDKRLAYFRENVYNPYRELYQKYPEELNYVPFQLEVKEMQLGYGIEMIFKDVLPKLQHGNDGLIFTCRETSYQFGTDQHILKWKSADLNSIDFRMQLQFPMLDQPDLAEYEGEGPWPNYDAKPQFNIFAHGGGNKDIPFGQMGLDWKQWEEMKRLDEPLNDRIVECFLDKRKVWRFMRFRDDKKEANHISVVDSVMESINDAVSEDTLIAASKAIRDGWKKRQAQREMKAAQAAQDAKAAQRAKAEQDAKAAHEASGGEVDSAVEANGNTRTKRKFEGGVDD